LSITNSIPEKAKAHYVGRIRNKGCVAVNNGNIYHAYEVIVFTSASRSAYNAVHLPSVETCQHHTRLLSIKNQSNQVPDKITHFIGGELDRVDREVSVVMIQLQVVPHY